MVEVTQAVPRMLDQIRQPNVPTEVIKAAAAGEFDRPLVEKLEALVFLSSHALVGETARNTLQRTPDTDLVPIAQNPRSPRRVLNYFLVPLTRRKALLPWLVENPTVAESTLSVLGYTATRDLVEIMLDSPRVGKNPETLSSLAANTNLREHELQRVREMLGALGHELETGSVYDHDVELWILEHENEIAAEEGKAFALTDAVADELAETEAVAKAPPADLTRLSPLQRIARLTVGERVKLAMLGNKEERSILIRDGSKVVSSAVLASPKLTDGEVENIAAMKNVQESVLRDIARNRKFLKNYVVVRALVNNPRTPLDISITFVKNLLPQDLKGLSMNKNVPETLKKTALRSFKEKTSAPGQR